MTAGNKSAAFEDVTITVDLKDRTKTVATAKQDITVHEIVVITTAADSSPAESRRFTEVDKAGEILPRLINQWTKNRQF